MINLYNNRFRFIKEHINTVTFEPSAYILDTSTGISHIIPYNHVNKQKAINEFLLKLVESTRNDKIKYLISKNDNTDSSSK